MSRPGEFTDAELTVVDDVGSRLAKAYAPSWLKASDELEAAFGFRPRLTVTGGQPIGGYRTTAQQESLPGAAGVQYSDHPKGRGADIANHGRFRNINEVLFLQILANNGWRNVNTAGRPFPSEPWHFANQSSNPAGGGTPIIVEEDDMNETKYYYKTEGGTEYGIFGAQYPGGFEISTSEGTGQAWGKLYGKPDGSPWGTLDATVWSTLKAEAKVLNERWVAQQRAIFGGGSGADNSDVLKAVAGVSEQVTGLPSKTDLAQSETNVIAAMPKTFTAN